MKGDKKILKSILLGLLLGLILCGVAYAILMLVFQKPDGTVASGTNVEIKDKEYEKIDQSQYNVTKNEKLAAEFAAAEVLIPSKCEEVLAIQPPTMEIRNVQGSCTDGTYVYQIFYGEDLTYDGFNNQCVVVKCELETGNVVATSEPMQMNHANDVTYNSKLGYLVVCHNAPLNNMITYVNAETLEWVDTFATENYMYSIDYNATRDQYVVGLTGTKTFRILDAEFNEVTDIMQPASAYKSATNQGGACDDNYIYFVLYKTNVINVYDWDGNFVTSIELELQISYEDYEPESISVVGSDIYVYCGQGEATVFKISDFIPKPVEETEE